MNAWDLIGDVAITIQGAVAVICIIIAARLFIEIFREDKE